MTKDELRGVLGFVVSNWNMQGLTKFEGEQMAETWWSLLAPFDYDIVMAVVKRQAIKSPWKPRPADIARLVIDQELGDGAPPPTKAAVEQADEALRHAGLAQEPVALHPFLAETLRDYRTANYRFTKETFADWYEDRVADFYLAYLEQPR